MGAEKPVKCIVSASLTSGDVLQSCRCDELQKNKNKNKKQNKNRTKQNKTKTKTKNKNIEILYYGFIERQLMILFFDKLDRYIFDDGLSIVNIKL